MTRIAQFSRNSYDWETKQKAVSLVERGKRVSDVSETLNIPQATISTWVKNKREQVSELSQGRKKSCAPSETERSRKQKGFTLEERLAVIRKVRDGRPMQEVADQSGVYIATLRRWMKKDPAFKVPPRAKNSFTREKKIEIVSRVMQGETFSDMARAYGTSYQMVKYWYRTIGNNAKKNSTELDTKLRALDMLQRGKAVEVVAATMGASVSTINAWKKNPILKRKYQNKLRRDKYQEDKMKQTAKPNTVAAIMKQKAKPKSRVPASKKKAALSRLIRGCQPSDVASRLRIPLYIVAGWKEEIQTNVLSYPLEHILKAIEQNKIGVSLAEIARLMNATPETVKYWLGQKQLIQKLAGHAKYAAKQKSKEAGPKKNREQEKRKPEQEERVPRQKDREAKGKPGRPAKKSRHRTLVKNPLSMRLTRPEFSDKVLTSILVDFGFEEGEVQEWMDRKRGRGKVANNNNRGASPVDLDAAERPGYAVDPFDEDGSEQELRQIFNGAPSDGDEEEIRPIANYCHVTYEEAMKMCKA